MSKEINEEQFLKLRKEDVGHLATFQATTKVVSATEKWKRKSVSIVSPKSGRILRQKNKKNDPKADNVKEHTGFFSRLFEDFRKAKVSDYTYQQSKVRRYSSYKPFWATKVAERNEEPIFTVEDEVNKTTAAVSEKANINKSNYVFKKELPLPKVIVTDSYKAVQVKSADKVVVKKLSTVEDNPDNCLRLPPFYNGSQMFMPTGHRLYWV